MRRPLRARLFGCALVLTLLAGASSCTEDAASEPGDAVSSDGSDGSDGDGDGGDETAEGWTVLHYSMADNDLESFLVADVGEMAQVGSNENLTVRALVDRSTEESSDPLIDQGDYTGARVIDLGAPGTSELVAEAPDLNTGDPQVLADFIAEGIADHPAGHYALVISDHGASWPGIGPDMGSQDYLELAELQAGLADGLERAGVERLDLLGFDACLMASYEVASAVAPYADRMVASEELEPGHGWNYGALQVLADDPAASADDLGAALVDGFATQAEESGTAESITLSMIDLTRMGDVDAAVSDLATALGERAATVAPAVGRAEAATLGFNRNPDPTQDSQMVDLGLLAAAIGVEALDVSDQADAVQRALGDVVLANTTGPATAGASGLSIYFPETADYVDPGYAGIDSASDWRGFLDSYYGAGAEIPAAEQPEFLVAPDGAEVTFDEADELEIEAPFDPAGLDNIVGATVSYGQLLDDGSVAFLGEETAVYAVEGAEGYAAGSYDLTALSLSDGEDTVLAYTDLDLNDDLTIGTIATPVQYRPSYDPDVVREGLLQIVIDVTANEVLSRTLYVYQEETGAAGEVAPDPEGLIYPLVLVAPADGSEPTWEVTSDVGLYADVENLTYSFDRLDPGTPLQVDLAVTDFGGNSATASSYVEVP